MVREARPVLRLTFEPTPTGETLPEVFLHSPSTTPYSGYGLSKFTGFIYENFISIRRY